MLAPSPSADHQLRCAVAQITAPLERCSERAFLSYPSYIIADKLRDTEGSGRVSAPLDKPTAAWLLEPLRMGCGPRGPLPPAVV